MKTQAIVPGLYSADAQSHLLPPQAWASWVAERWRGQADWAVLDTGFGAGQHFLALWQAWLEHPQRCQRLHVVALEPHPLQAADLRLALRASAWAVWAEQLVQAWPPLTPNLHLLDFEQGRVRLTLGLGPRLALLRSLRMAADVVHLRHMDPGSAADKGVGRTVGGHSGLGVNSVTGSSVDVEGQRFTSTLLKSMGRLVAPGAVVLTAETSPVLAAGLRTAGFEPMAAAPTTRPGANTWVKGPPRFAPRRLTALQVPTADAAVIGAGLAGAAVARALAQQGLRVTVLEREAAPAQGASGNPAALFHGAVHPQDGAYARLYRAAALLAASTYRQALQGGRVAGQVQGLLRLQDDAQGLAGMARTLHELGLPSNYVQALCSADASALAGVALQRPCWYYPSGGWMAPADWVRQALQSPLISLRTGAAAQRLERSGSYWQVLAANGQLLARSELLVLCQADNTAPLLQSLGWAAWPLSSSRGQVTHWTLQTPSALRLPVAGEGYALPLQHGRLIDRLEGRVCDPFSGPFGDSSSDPSTGPSTGPFNGPFSGPFIGPLSDPSSGLLCGATRHEGDTDPALRQSDHLHNVARLQSLTGLVPPADPSSWQGRVGWRLNTDDRLPIAGALPLLAMPAAQRLDQSRLIPRERGLFVLTALGARGLSWAPLLARLVAAQATATPWPLEQDLVDAVDPARWMVRAARRQPPQPA